MKNEEQEQAGNRWDDIIQWVLLGWCLGVIYNTVLMHLALRNDAAWVRRASYFREAWQKAKEDVRMHLEAEKHQEDKHDE